MHIDPIKLKNTRGVAFTPILVVNEKKTQSDEGCYLRSLNCDNNLSR